MRPVALLLTFLMLLAPMAGCISSEELPAPVIEDETVDGVWVTGGDGLPVDVEPFDTTYYVNDVGQQGPEPSIGVTSSGCIFFIALEKVMRSCDSGETWVNTVEGDVTQAPSTSDPWGWVDPLTDRIFNVQMVGLATTWIGWSDDDGETWLGNPHDSGPVPLNDHIKLATGPWTDSGYGAIGSPVYDTAVYFCYNKLAGIFCYTSLDGGATFAVGGQAFGLVTTNGGLHGAISSAPDGTVYVPPRVATPTLVVSKDNGLNWEEKTMGEDVGTPNPRKNSEMAADTESNGYHVWTGADQGVYMSRSTDSGDSWEQTSLRISPVEVVSSVFPQIIAGDPRPDGRRLPRQRGRRRPWRAGHRRKPMGRQRPLRHGERELRSLRHLQPERLGREPSFPNRSRHTGPGSGRLDLPEQRRLQGYWGLQ